MTTLCDKPVPAPPPFAVAAVDAGKAYVLAAVARGESPLLADVAAAAGYSPFHFHRMFHRLHGATFKAFVLAAQVERAKGLMLAGMPLSEVATSCGFCHQSSLTTRFRQAAGITPGQWLREQRRATAAGVA